LWRAWRPSNEISPVGGSLPHTEDAEPEGQLIGQPSAAPPSVPPGERCYEYNTAVKSEQMFEGLDGHLQQHSILAVGRAVEGVVPDHGSRRRTLTENDSVIVLPPAAPFWDASQSVSSSSSTFRMALTSKVSRSFPSTACVPMRVTGM